MGEFGINNLGGKESKSPANSLMRVKWGSN